MEPRENEIKRMKEQIRKVGYYHDMISLSLSHSHTHTHTHTHTHRGLHLHIHVHTHTHTHSCIQLEHLVTNEHYTLNTFFFPSRWRLNLVSSVVITKPSSWPWLRRTFASTPQPRRCYKRGKRLVEAITQDYNKFFIHTLHEKESKS